MTRLNSMNERVAKELLFKGYFIAGRLHSPRIGDFPFYPDNRILFSNTKKLKIVAEELARVISPLNVDLIASREAAGVPFGVATALELQSGFLYLRKEPKNYNVRKVIEGSYQPGQTVVIVDDAISTGGDKRKVVDDLEAVGLKVLGVVVAFDAHYGPKYAETQQWLRAGNQYVFQALMTWPEIMDYAADNNFLSRELCDMVKEMINDPEVWQKSDKNWQQFKQIAAKEQNLIFDQSFRDI